MTAAEDNRFQDFFEDDKYVALKNHLYNYQLRKRAVEKVMQDEDKDLVLEIGSGISPVLTSWNRVVYSDLSFSALRHLSRIQEKGYYVVADGMNLPFRDASFSHVISSEVLEHIEDDRRALSEIARTIRPGGALIVTFPHRRFYFSIDDRFVNHHRRYELSEMISRLEEAGLHPVSVQKVLGPLEKIAMILVITSISIFQGSLKKQTQAPQSKPPDILIRFFKWANRVFAGLARIDALVMPRSLSTVLLIKAVKTDS